MNGSVQQWKDTCLDFRGKNYLDHLVQCFNQEQVYQLKKLEIKMEILLPFS